MWTCRVGNCCLLALTLAMAGAHAHADDLRVVAAGAAKHALEALVPVFERDTGHRVRMSFDTVGAQRDRVLQAQPGGAADVVVLSDAALAQLGSAGRLAPGPAVRLGAVVVAVATRRGAEPAPVVTDEASLKAALLAADSIGYADPSRGATAGAHFQRALEAMGLRETLRDKTVMLPFGVDVIAAVEDGRIALGISQSSEIVPHAGVRLAGALPAPHAQSTGYAAAAASDADIARLFLRFLASAPAAAEFRASGFLPP